MDEPRHGSSDRGRRAAGCAAARQVLSTLADGGTHPEDDLRELRRHYRRLAGRIEG